MKEIGGFFELELTQGKEFHKNAISLNTGRNAFEYLLKAKKYQKVYLPYYTCDVMLEPIEKLNIELEQYHIDLSFKPEFDFSRIKENEVFVYTNYFGICDIQVAEILAICKNIIIDSSQSFFSIQGTEVDTFYSARKFFGVSDGAYLYTDKRLNENFEIDVSYKRFEHLLGRIDLMAESFYNSFKKNEEALSQQPILQMSHLTKRILSSIDYQKAYQKRQENFRYIQSLLNNTNELNLNAELFTSPLIYPYLIQHGENLKRKLIQHKIYIPTYWPNLSVGLNKNEMYFSRNLLALPIDQRYSKQDMEKIISIVKSNA